MSHRFSVGSGLAAAAALSVLLSGCAGGGTGAVSSSPQAPPPVPRPATSSVAVEPSVPAATTAALSTYGWVAGFKIALTRATADPAASTLTLDVLVTNTAQRDAGLDAVSAEILLDPGDETGLVAARALKPATDIVAGSTAHGAVSFDIPTGFSLAKAQLVLGKPANHQWLVPLQSGRPATGAEPIVLPAPAPLTTASSVYYRIASAQLLPWSCSGITPFTGYVPSDKHTSVVAISGTVGAGQLAGYAGTIERVSITGPDGTTAASITAPLKTWTSNQSLPNILQCLPVPADAHGVFTITISDQQHSTASAKITIP